MADSGSVGRGRIAAELLLLHRLPRIVAVAVVVVGGAGCAVAGVAALDLQRHFAAAADGGRLATLLAQGSTGVTAWEGWTAAMFFLVALLRLRRGAPEPPAGRTPLESLTVVQMRTGLVREYTFVRVGMVALDAVAVIEAARGARYAVAAAGGDAVASGSLLATLVEAGGVAVAAFVLTLWALSFRQQLLRLGAVD